MKITRRNLLAASAAFAVTPALAQPAKNMTLVVPFPPGGSTDALARLLQSHLQTKLGRTVLVENKSGAAGSLGAIQVAKSAPDGATFLVTFDSHAVIPSILEKPGLDVEKDLVPVFLVGTAPYVVAANAERPYKNFADVVAACKANPGAVKYASVGIGTLGHLAMTVLGKKAGVEITHVPYRGGGPAMNDVLGGHVDHDRRDRRRWSRRNSAPTCCVPILQMGRERMPVLKDTQTAIEAGYPDFETLAWWGVFAPKDTPPECHRQHGEIGEGDSERAGGSDAIAGDAADDAAARRRQGVFDVLRQAGQHLGPGRAREQHQGVGRATRRPAYWLEPSMDGSFWLSRSNIPSVLRRRNPALFNVARERSEGWRCRARFGMKRSSTRLLGGSAVP